MMHDRKQPPPGAFSCLPIVEPHERPLEAILSGSYGGEREGQTEAWVPGQAGILAMVSSVIYFMD
ncbi:hypothetical protein, partial [Mesorhizobium sp. M0243]|uniref:hypothetical protein n=1 Tax=Mesorhizobium sp. M0243 TaxID=2956925 RepID=UPI00333C8F01